MEGQRMNLFITADKIGTKTGGGLVTHHEWEALKRMGPTIVCSRDIWDDVAALVFPADPFEQDVFFLRQIQHGIIHRQINGRRIDLVHCYAGCLTETVKYLKSIGAKVTYTAAAHSIEESHREHEVLGLRYDYPHLTDPELFGRYVGGYLAADRLIVPSTHSRDVMRGFGAQGTISIIPHGVDIPSEPIAPYPSLFTLGYLGAIGPDKGLIYLLQAWKKLNYKDAMLVIAGRDSNSPFMWHLVEKYGGGCIRLAGWQHSLADFYNSISVYCQPSVSEGWGCEVVEAVAHGRPVIVSAGAGAVDFLTDLECGGAGLWFSPRDVDELCNCIDHYRHFQKDIEIDGRTAREQARKYTWDKIEQMYVNVWKELLT